MAFTKLSNTQLEKLKVADKVAVSALDITGSSELGSALQGTDEFVVQRSGGVPLAIPASAMQDFFSNLDIADLDGTASEFELIFRNGTGGAVGYDSDGITWNPSSDTLSLENIDVDGTANLDAVDIDGNVQADGSITVGVDDTGYDVLFYGATSGKFMKWSQADDSLIITGDASDALKVAGGVDIDGNIVVGVDDTGYDVEFFGATSGKSMKWSQGDDSLIITGDAVDALKVAGGVDIDGDVQIDAGDLTVGVDGTGRDVKFHGDTVGAYMQWDQSADDLILAGDAGLILPVDKLTIGSTVVNATAAELNLLHDASASNNVASKAVILDGSGDLIMPEGRKIKTDFLEVETLNSVTKTATTLEIADKLLVIASGSAALADANDGGLQWGGPSANAAAVLYDSANAALDFNIAGTTQVRLQDGALLPDQNNDVCLLYTSPSPRDG